MKCESCIAPCIECISDLLCETCLIGYIVVNNICITCNATTIPINNLCMPCTSPCYSCSTITTNCTSCDPTILPPVFLTGNNCVLAANCPSGFYANTSNIQCTPCTSPCSTCTSQLTCLTCVSTYSLYNDFCYTNCLSGYLSVNSVCLACISPC